MDEKIKRFGQIYACFVDRPLEGALVVTTNDMTTVLVAHVVQDYDSRSSSDIAFTVADAFENPRSYTNRIVGYIQRQQEALAQSLGELDEADRSRCASLVAPLPEVCTDIDADPVLRLQSLVAEVHRRVMGDDRRVTWCFSPAEIHDHEAYGRFMTALLVMPRPKGFRLVVRDPSENPWIGRFVDPGDETIVAVDFSVSLDDFKDATARRAVDSSLPAERRLPALLELALLDYGEGRIEDAERKYRYMIAHGEPSLAGIRALSWHGLAEIAERSGNLTEARNHLEHALAECEGQKIAPVEYTVCAALGRIAAALGDFRLAAESFTCASALAVALRSPERCAENMEALGDARQALGEASEACNAWATAAELCWRVGAADRAHAVERKLGELQHPSSPGAGSR